MSEQSVSLDGVIEIDWGGDIRPFRLGIGELRALQERTGCGPDLLLKRLRDGNWLVDHPREVLRFGLEGGGAAPKEARALLERYFDDVARFPLWPNILVAQAVLGRALAGPADDPAGKAKAVERKSRTSRKGGGASLPSTAPAGAPASAPSRQTG